MPIARSGRPQSEHTSERVYMCLPPLRLQLLVANPISRPIARTGNPGRGGGARRHDHNAMVCWGQTRDNKTLQKVSPPCVLSGDDMFLGGGTWSIDKDATCGRLHLGSGRDKGKREAWRCTRGGAVLFSHVTDFSDFFFFFFFSFYPSFMTQSAISKRLRRSQNMRALIK